jgi:WS/DGAT/MGAT family acyltransferase
MAPAALAFASDLLLRPQKFPHSRFNSIVSPHRVFETRRFLIDEFKEIRRLVPGATINDAVLAICGGGIRSYLERNAELPEASLTAIAPIAIRGADAEDPDRAQVSWLRVELGTDIADPVERLAHVHRQTSSSTTISQAISARELTDVGRYAPAAALAVTSKMLARASLGIGRRTPLANCTISNVPGPSQPLYLNGARMTFFSAIMPINDGMGLVFAVTSYDDKIILSPTSCRELIPDPEVFAQCVRDCFQDYLAIARERDAAKAGQPKAAGRKPAAAKPVRPARPRVSAAGRRSPSPRSARTAATAPQAAQGGRRRSTGPSR